MTTIVAEREVAFAPKITGASSKKRGAAALRRINAGLEAQVATLERRVKGLGYAADAWKEKAQQYRAELDAIYDVDDDDALLGVYQTRAQAKDHPADALRPDTPIGTHVWYRSVAREGHPWVETTTTSLPWLLAGGAQLVKVECFSGGISGGVSTQRRFIRTVKP